MANAKASEELEHEIEQERSALARSLEDLQAQFSTENIVSSLPDHITTGGGEMVNTIVDTARRNPVPTALIGIGAAWLLTNMATRSDDDEGQKPAFDPRSNPTSRGFASEEPELAGFDERVEEAAEKIRQQPHVGRDDWGYYVEAAANGDADSKDAIEGVSDVARDWGERVYARAEELADRLGEGTEEMSEAARARIKRIRMKALSAQLKIEQAASRASDRLSRTAQEQPLLLGAAALAAGAALGAALPRTEREDRILGAHRDRLFDEAERIFHEEKAKLRAVAEAAVDEGKSVLTEAARIDDGNLPSGSEIVSKAEEKGKSALRRVSDAARDEAKRQNIGSGH